MTAATQRCVPLCSGGTRACEPWRSAAMSSLDEVMFYTLVAGDLGCAANAIAVYEAVINLDREVATVWQREWTWPSTILVVLRLTSILQLSVVWADNPPAICEPSILIAESAYVISCLAIATFGALRVHGISGGRFFLSVTSFILLAAPRSLDIIVMVQASYGYNGAPLNGCFQVPTPRGQHIVQMFGPLGLACLLAGYLLILLVTWRMSLQQWLALRRLKQQTALWTLLLRDGTLEFITVAVFATISVIVAQSPQTAFTNILACFQPFYQSLPAVIICRLIVSLRQLHDHDASLHADTDELNYEGSLLFRTRRPRADGEGGSLNGLETDFSRRVEFGNGGISESAVLSTEA